MRLLTRALAALALLFAGLIGPQLAQAATPPPSTSTPGP